MDKIRLSRASLLAQAPPIESWPELPDNIVSEESRELFNRRCKAVEMYLDNEFLVDIELATNVHRTSIASLLQKCLQLDPDGKILGFNGLIPFARTKDYVRTADIKHKFKEDQGGLSGLLQLTLNKYPDLDKKLKNLILKKNSFGMNTHEKKISPKQLHQVFIKYIREKGVKDNEWPFNTKHLGITSIRKYVNNVLNQHFSRSVRVREEQDSIAHLAVGTGHSSFLNHEEPFDAVQFDAYNIDAFFSVDFVTPEAFEIDVQLDRLWLITLIESISRAILAYAVIYRSQISATDLLDVLRNAIDPPQRLEISIPGLSYPENAGLPHEVIHECKGIAWNTIYLDGALAHLAKIIQTDVRDSLGMSINWGPVAHFERRSIQERFFEKVATDLFQRLPSTTGSNPLKGRAKNAEDVAVKYKIRADEIEQLLAIYVAQYNATPNEGTSFLSPLDILKSFFHDQKGHFLPRRLPTHTGQSSNPIPIVREVVVRGGIKSGRRPYIVFERERYTNGALSQAAGLVGKRLKIHIDPRDLRQVRAFLPNGSELGFLKVMGRWQYTKHSWKTRKIINSLVSKKLLAVSKFVDPVQVYMNFLSIRNKKTTRKTKDLNPQNATEAVRLAKETGLQRKISPRPEQTKTDDLDFSSFDRASLMPTPMPDIKKLLNKK